MCRFKSTTKKLMFSETTPFGMQASLSKDEKFLLTSVRALNRTIWVEKSPNVNWLFHFF